MIDQPNELVVSGVTVHGFAYYYIEISNVEFNVANKVAVWMPNPTMKGPATFCDQYFTSHSQYSRQLSDTCIQLCS